MAGGAARREADQSLRPRTEQLLREGHSLHQSLKMTDDALDSVIQARESLGNQRVTMMGVTGKLKNLGAKFPVIGQLMNRISCKHQRDMIVLASVIAVCMIFTFLYVMSKP
jgi:Golgi SNAP receptor complex protein 1